MLTANQLYFVDIAVVDDNSIRRIRVSVKATFADPTLLAAALPEVSEALLDTYALLLAQHDNGVCLAATDTEVDTISTRPEMEHFLDVVSTSVRYSMQIADGSQANHIAQSTNANPLVNTAHASNYSRYIHWLRRLQLVAGAAFVPSSIYAAIDAIRAQSAGTAACIATICTAVGGATTTAIQWLETHHARAVAEAAAMPIAELSGINAV